MNASNIDALAMAAETRAKNEVKARSDGVIAPDNVRSESNFNIEIHGAVTNSSQDATAAAAVPSHARNADVQSTIQAPTPTNNDDRRVNSSIENVQQQLLMRVEGNHHDERAHGQRRAPSVTSTNYGHKPNFAEKLHAILANENFNTVITWLPSGKSFCILDEEEFTETVLPQYFHEAEFESFSRRIKGWGFQKTYTNGQKQVVYSHDLFQKDRFDLCKMMDGPAESSDEESSNTMACNCAHLDNVEAQELSMAERSLHARRQHSVQVTTIVQPTPTLPTSQTHWTPHQLPIMASHETAAMGSPYFHMHNVHSSAMVNGPPQAYIANDQRQPVLEPRPPLMPNGMIDWNAAGRQLSALDEEIADLDEQLAILNRLKALNERRRQR